MAFFGNTGGHPDLLEVWEETGDGRRRRWAALAKPSQQVGELLKDKRLRAPGFGRHEVVLRTVGQRFSEQPFTFPGSLLL